MGLTPRKSCRAFLSSVERIYTLAHEEVVFWDTVCNVNLGRISMFSWFQMTSPQGTWALLADSTAIRYQKGGKKVVKSCSRLELQNSIFLFWLPSLLCDVLLFLSFSSWKLWERRPAGIVSISKLWKDRNRSNTPAMKKRFSCFQACYRQIDWKRKKKHSGFLGGQPYS